MTRRRSTRLPGQTLDAAAEWFVEFSGGSVDTAAREEFMRWLRVSPEHVRAYLQISAHWEGADVLGRTDQRSVDELVAFGRDGANVVSVDMATDCGSVDRREADTLTTGACRRRWRWAAALAASAVITIVSFWVHDGRKVYRTGIGEQRFIMLTDGSTVEINARSRVRVSFSREQREVDLLEGQALFSVARDQARPFVVHSGKTRIRAIGTQFDVHRKTTGTVVSVVEGTVSVSASLPDSSHLASGRTTEAAARDNGKQQNMMSASGPASEFTLSAGEQLTVSRSAATRPARADVAAAMAWTQKRIIFRDAPLTEVVEEFNRYNVRQMTIADRRVESLRISGVFSSTDPESLLRGLQAQGVFSVRRTPDAIEISSR